MSRGFNRGRPARAERQIRPARWVRTGSTPFLAAIMLASATGIAPAQEPTLRVQATRVLLPLVTPEALDAGRVASDPARGVCALELDIADGAPARGWVIYVRTDGAAFQPETAGKPAAHLRWKFDHEDERSWRPLDEHETTVLENPGGGDAKILVDLSVDLGWETDPGTYGLGILFRVAGL